MKKPQEENFTETLLKKTRSNFSSHLNLTGPQILICMHAKQFYLIHVNGQQKRERKYVETSVEQQQDIYI